MHFMHVLSHVHLNACKYISISQLLSCKFH